MILGVNLSFLTNSIIYKRGGISNRCGYLAAIRQQWALSFRQILFGENIYANLERIVTSYKREKQALPGSNLLEITRLAEMAEGAMPPSFPLAIPVINDNNGKIYTFMTNLSPLQTYINRLCQIRRLRLRFFLQSQLFHATQELMIRNEHSACLNHTTYNNKTINSLVFARSISRSWQ